jgi:hypothetical protein
MSVPALDVLIAQETAPLQAIAQKIIRKERISPADGLLLFQSGSLSFLGALANHVRERLHGHVTYFNRNFHIEPTNICVFSCSFCSYSRLYAHKEEGWELSNDDMLNIVKKYDANGDRIIVPVLTEFQIDLKEQWPKLISALSIAYTKEYVDNDKEWNMVKFFVINQDNTGKYKYESFKSE